MEGAPKIDRNELKIENNESKSTHLERFRKSFKPMLAYGLYALTLFNLSEKQNQKFEGDEDNVQITNASEPNQKEFNYYSSEIFQDFDSFKEQVSKDPGFMEGVNYGSYEYEYSQEYIDDLEEMYNSFPENDTIITDDGFLTKSEFRKDIESIKKTIHNINPREKAEEDHLFEKYSAGQEQVKDIESQKKWLIEIVSSKKYFDRLVKEIGNEGNAKWVQRARLNRLESNKYFVSNDNLFSTDGALGHVQRIEKDGFIEYPAFLANEKYIDEDQKEHNLTPIHEFEHQATIDLLIDETESLLVNNVEFDKFTDLEHESIDYYLETDEIMARKRVFDYQLDKLGIKKYKEDFTQDHYQKIKELQEQGKLERGADLFFRMYKKDSLMLIMNTVAENINQNPTDTIEWKDAVKINNEGFA